MESDESLYERMQGGEMAAFDALYQRYERRLFGFVRSYLGDAAEAEDVFHEAFLAVLRKRPPALDRGSFRGWLYQVARNLCLNRLRSERRGAEARRAVAGEASAVESAPDRLELREQGAALELAVAKLPLALAELFRLRSSGMSYEEMSSVLELPLGTVKSRMHEMVRCLREEMETWTAD
jgi:RNA polymerase sigma-70 factor (ECF subfamily)